MGILNTTERVEEIRQLASSAYLQYEMAIPNEKREMLKRLTSNRTVKPNDVAVELSPEFREIANRTISPYGAPYRDTPETLDELLHKLVRIVISQGPADEYRSDSARRLLEAV
jgi:hypothetical protein